MSPYEERSHLLAILSTNYPDSHRAPASDAEPGFTQVVCIHFPFGSYAWHLADSDIYLFGGLPLTDSHYDGHSTEEKYVAIKESLGWVTYG